MTLSRRFWFSYVAVILVLSFSVAWTIFQVIQLHERADHAEEIVEDIAEELPLGEREWEFYIDDGLVLDCDEAIMEGRGVWVCYSDR